MEEKKAVVMALEGEFFVIKVDPNKDGEALMEIKVNLKESADEVAALFKKD